MMKADDDYIRQSGSLAGYNYRRMVIDLEHGREIEFTCNNKEFGIFMAMGGRGWYLSEAKPEQKMQSDYYPDVHDLIRVIRIDGKTLEALWADSDLTDKDIIHVF